nr:transposase [Streptomyces lateritius]
MTPSDRRVLRGRAATCWRRCRKSRSRRAGCPHRGSTATARSFSAIARERRGQDLASWMTRALDQGPSPVQGFAAFLQNDWDAVVNGLTLPWSSGAIEGQVIRIKLSKRRSYGRASFALLRTLVLAQPP